MGGGRSERRLKGERTEPRRVNAVEVGVASGSRLTRWNYFSNPEVGCPVNLTRSGKRTF
jgi:hypothetical protein